MKKTISVAAIAATALIAGVLASPAAAFHIPGATYGGVVCTPGASPADPCPGSLSFNVSGDGSSITNLRVNGPIPGRPLCFVISFEDPNPTPILGHAFNSGEVSGSFPDVRRAQGSISIVDISCTTAAGVVWNASTSASPAGSEECKAAQARLKKQKKLLTNAKKTGDEAKIKKLQKKLKKAKNYRNQVCG